MDPLDVVRSRQVEDVDVPAKVPRIVTETLAADVLLGQRKLLHLRPHPSVEDEDPFSKNLLELCSRAHGRLLRRL